MEMFVICERHYKSCSIATNYANYSVNRGNTDNVFNFKEWLKIDDPHFEYVLFQFQSAILL